jgi:hypothetical protein
VPHCPPDGVGHRQPHALTNRNAASRFVTKAEQRVASGVAAKADGRVFNCQWRLVAESANVHRKLLCTFECDVTFWLVNYCSSAEVQSERWHESVTL